MNQLLTVIIEDRTVPRNIRLSAEGVQKTLQKGNEPIELKVSQAISVLDEISNDPNIPSYIRTQVWSIVSLLEKCRNSKI